VRVACLPVGRLLQNCCMDAASSVLYRLIFTSGVATWQPTTLLSPPLQPPTVRHPPPLSLFYMQKWIITQAGDIFQQSYSYLYSYSGQEVISINDVFRPHDFICPPVFPCSDRSIIKELFWVSNIFHSTDMI
jgi:hypothetical protein